LRFSTVSRVGRPWRTREKVTALTPAAFSPAGTYENVSPFQWRSGKAWRPPGPRWSVSRLPRAATVAGP
jgi:hypothetical protein